MEKCELTFAACEELLQRIKGVISVSVIGPSEGNISEIHILAGGLRNPKQIVRDIQSAIAAAFGVTVEYRIISVAQIEDALLPRTADKRLVIIGTAQSVIKGKHKVSVTLSCGDTEYTGSYESAYSPYSAHFAAAYACIDAINSFSSKCVFNVLDVKKIIIADQCVWNVAIEYAANGMNALVCGAVFENGDECNSIIRATLDAVNRLVAYDEQSSQ